MNKWSNNPRFQVLYLTSFLAVFLVFAVSGAHDVTLFSHHPRGCHMVSVAEFWPLSSFPLQNSISCPFIQVSNSWAKWNFLRACGVYCLLLRSFHSSVTGCCPKDKHCLPTLAMCTTSRHCFFLSWLPDSQPSVQFDEHLLNNNFVRTLVRH